MYYYKLFVKEGIEDSLKSIKAPDSFIKSILENSSSFKYQIEEGMEEFYVGYNIEKVRKGKTDEIWTWASHKEYYKKNWNYKGEVHPHRKDKISKLKKLWDNDSI